MEQSFTRKSPSLPLGLRLKRLSRVAGGALLLALLPVALLWLFAREDVVRFYGFVESSGENVGPVLASRILSIEVAPGSQVKAGDVLVKFDASGNQLEAAMNEVRVKEFEQSLQRQRENLQESERRCRQIVSEAEVQLAERALEKAREAAELEALEAEMARLKPLVEKKLVGELELSALRPRAETLRLSVARYAPLEKALSNRLEQASRDLAEVQRALEKFEAGHSAASEGVVREAARLSNELRAVDPTVLRAHANGVVSQVLHQPGDVVAAGEPVLRLASGGISQRIVGMLPSDLLDEVQVGDELYVYRHSAAGVARSPEKAQVETIDPEVLDFFDPLNAAPRVPVRGRKVHLKMVLGSTAEFIPGETVMLTTVRTSAGDSTWRRFFHRGTWGN